jgi:hypothetical protein
MPRVARFSIAPVRSLGLDQPERGAWGEVERPGIIRIVDELEVLA